MLIVFKVCKYGSCEYLFYICSSDSKWHILSLGYTEVRTNVTVEL